MPAEFCCASHFDEDEIASRAPLHEDSREVIHLEGRGKLEPLQVSLLGSRFTQESRGIALRLPSLLKVPKPGRQKTPHPSVFAHLFNHSLIHPVMRLSVTQTSKSLMQSYFFSLVLWSFN